MHWMKWTAENKPLVMWCYSMGEKKHSRVLQLDLSLLVSLWPSAMRFTIATLFLPPTCWLGKNGWIGLELSICLPPGQLDFDKTQEVRPLAKQLVLRIGLKIWWNTLVYFTIVPFPSSCQNPSRDFSLIFNDNLAELQEGNHKSMGASHRLFFFFYSEPLAIPITVQGFLPLFQCLYRFLVLGFYFSKLSFSISAYLLPQFCGQWLALWSHSCNESKNCWFFSLFSFLLIRMESWLPSSLHVGLETGSIMRFFTMR